MSLATFKALADETRLRIAHILFHYELSVNELAQILGMGQSRVSRHLKILTTAGLLSSRRDGLWVFYSAPSNGQGLKFLQAIMPFLPNEEPLTGDLLQATHILEERARKTRQFFNAIADDWDALNHEILGDFNLCAKVMDAMPANCETAVDLGCGTGEVLAGVLEHAQAAIGVDGSARMLELCRSRLVNSEASGRLSLRIGELSHLPLADKEADFACLNLVLHHLPQPEAILPEIRRILKPSGILFLTDFLRHEDESMRIRFGDHWLGFDPDQIRQALIRNEFAICRTVTETVNKNLSLFLITARLLSQ